MQIEARMTESTKEETTTETEPEIQTGFKGDFQSSVEEIPFEVILQDMVLHKKTNVKRKRFLLLGT